MPVQFSYVNHNNQESLSLILDGKLETFVRNDDNWDTFEDLLNTLQYGNWDQNVEYIHELVYGKKEFPLKLQRLSERISFANGKIYFDGDVIDTVLSRHVVRLIKDGDKGAQAFVNFMENLAGNPSPISRIQLFPWLEARDFTITEDGYIVGYKSVKKDTLLSHYNGSNTVFVDGEAVTGQVPNYIGSTIEIARTEVNHDREQGCSYGLHVGTWDYASTFNPSTSVILQVLVNPRDVVSVPRECSFQKMRVARYTVVDVIEQPFDEALIYSTFDNDQDEDFDDEDYDTDDYYDNVYYSNS